MLNEMLRNGKIQPYPTNNWRVAVFSEPTNTEIKTLLYRQQFGQHGHHFQQDCQHRLINQHQLDWSFQPPQNQYFL